jgi:hypothetical protein
MFSRDGALDIETVCLGRESIVEGPTEQDGKSCPPLAVAPMAKSTFARNSLLDVDFFKVGRSLSHLNCYTAARNEYF